MARGKSFRSNKISNEIICSLFDCYSAKKFILAHLKTILAVLSISLVIATLVWLRLYCSPKQFQYKERGLKMVEAKGNHLSKYIVVLTMGDLAGKITVPLMGGNEYCFGLKGVLNGTKFKRVRQVEAYAKVYNTSTNGLVVYFYNRKGFSQPIFSNQTSSKLKAMKKYVHYIDDSFHLFNFSFTGPYNYHNGEFTFTPTHIPPSTRVVIATDYLTSYYFEEMVEHFFKNKLHLTIIYLFPMECLIESHVEVDRTSKSEPCHLLQRWAKISNKTGRGLASNITLQTLTVPNYELLRNSEMELIDLFYDVWNEEAPWRRIRVLVFSSHAFQLAKTTGDFMKYLKIKDYYKVNCVEKY